MAQGRALNDQDRAGGVQVAVVNENFAKKFLAGVDPLSQRILVEQLIPGVTKLGPPVAWQIVGVYHDVRNGRLEEDFPEIDVPFWQSPWPQTLISLRAGVEPENLTKSIAAIVQSMDPDLPLGESPDDGTNHGPIVVAAAIHSRFVRRLRRHRAAARRGGNLWRDVFRRRAAHPRDRPPHGARRWTKQTCSR